MTSSSPPSGTAEATEPTSLVFDFRCDDVPEQATDAEDEDEEGVGLPTEDAMPSPTSHSTQSASTCDAVHGYGVESNDRIEAPLPWNSPDWQGEADGLTLEFWLTPAQYASQNHHKDESIFAISRRALTDAEWTDDIPQAIAMDWIGCQGYFFYAAQRGPHLVLHYEDNDAASSCRVLVVRQQDLLPDRLLHVAYVLGSGRTSLYLNGLPMIQDVPNYFTQQESAGSIWGGTNLTFAEFFGAAFRMNDAAFRGTLRSVALHPHAMNEVGVQHAYADRLREMKLKRAMEIEARLSDLTLQIKEASQTELMLQERTAETPIVIGPLDASMLRMTVAGVDIAVQLQIVDVPQQGMLQLNHGGGDADHNTTRDVVMDMNVANVEAHSLHSFDVDTRASDITFASMFVYQPFAVDYFNRPTTSFLGDPLLVEPDSFSYRLVAHAPNDTDFGSEQFVSCEIAVQSLEVIHVNHPPTLDASNVTTAMTSEDSSNDDLSSRPITLIGGVRFFDQDLDIDRVRVTLQATNGTMTIASDQLRSVPDFTSCTRRTNWQCVGTGHEDRIMTFLILPSQVEVIINELEFTGFKYGQPGQVRMDVWDGVDDASCLNAEEHNAASVHFGCYHVGAAISIPAVSHRDGEIGSTEEGFVRELFEFQDLPDFIFWGTVLMIMVCCCLGVRRCCDCMRSCRARGSKIPIDMHEQMRHRRPIAWEYNPGSHNV